MKTIILLVILSIVFTCSVNAGAPAQVGTIGGHPAIGPGHEPPRMPYCGSIYYYDTTVIPGHNRLVRVCGVTLASCNTSYNQELNHIANQGLTILNYSQCFPF